LQICFAQRPIHQKPIVPNLDPRIRPLTFRLLNPILLPDGRVRGIAGGGENSADRVYPGFIPRQPDQHAVAGTDLAGVLPYIPQLNGFGLQRSENFVLIWVSLENPDLS